MDNFLKLSYLTIKNIRRSLGRNLIMVVFVFVAVFLMNLSLANFRYTNYLDRFAETSGLYDSFLYAGEPIKQAYSADSYEAARQYVADELKQLKADGAIADYSIISQAGEALGEKSDERADFLFMKPELLKELSMPVADGDWFDAYSSENGELTPVVIGSGLKSVYRTGDRFMEAVTGKECVVIGVLRRGARFLNPNVGGTGMDLNNAIQAADKLVIVAAESPMNGSFLVRLSEQTASEQAVLEKIGDVSNAFSFRSLADHAHEDNQYLTQMQTTLAVMALLICVVGTACGNLLSFVRGKRRQAVYFLCGMEPRTGVYCMALENLTKLYLPALVGLCAFFSYCKRQEYDRMLASASNVWVTLAVITVIFVAALLRPIALAKGSAPLKVIETS